MTATRDELLAAVADYVEQVNGNDEIKRTFRRWDCVIRVSAIDLDAAFTLTVEGGTVTSFDDGAEAVPDLVVNASSTDLLEIFWGEVNPAQRYTDGAVTIQGPQEHLMRLDAMTMLVFLD